MKLIITKPNKSDIQIFGALWLVVFPLLYFFHSDIQTVSSRLVVMLADFVFLTSIVYIVVYILFPTFFQSKKYLLFCLSFFLVQLFFSLLYLQVYIYLGFDLESQDYSFWEFVATDTIENTKSLGIFIAMLITKKFYESKSDLLELEKESKSNQLKWLKSQIDPHFLFNNLNALDDLIDRDTSAAKKYLHKLSTLYRYLISNQDHDLVPLEEEWNFVDNYLYLLEERYGTVYQFNKANQLGTLHDLLIPPASLQGLIENVVKHNHGSEQSPLKVNITIDQQGISVYHLKRPKKSFIDSHGTGLQNMKARYQLLSNQEITIEDKDYFKVTLPLIHQVH